MAYFEGNKMTGGYGKGPDIINSCTVNVNKGEIVSIGYQGQYGVEAIELIARIEFGVCRFRRDKLSNRRDPLPNTEDIITHFLQHAKSPKTDIVPTSNDNAVESQQQVQQLRENQNEKTIL